MTTKIHDEIEYDYFFLDLMQYSDFFICRWEVKRKDGSLAWIHEVNRGGLLNISMYEIDSLL